MAEGLEKQLAKWLAAGVVDAAAAERIRKFEEKQSPGERLRWPIVLALGLGGLLLCAGILLFVAAHWEEMPPSTRFSLVLLLAAFFPVCGSLGAEKFPALGTTFHAIGTICLGAGIYLAAQIFNLQENWSNGILLWAAAALAGWLLLGSWPQAGILAVLLPLWLTGQWSDRLGANWERGSIALWDGWLLLALTYFSAQKPQQDSTTRKMLGWLGGFAILPAAAAVVIMQADIANHLGGTMKKDVPAALAVIGWTVAIGGPLTLAFVLRREAMWMNAISAMWVVALGLVTPKKYFRWDSWDVLGFYAWGAIGAAGLIVWGIAERRRERVNLGVAGFGITVLFFYFSNVMDKMGRAESLVGIGVLLIFGGWGLEMVRRRLMARLEERVP